MVRQYDPDDPDDPDDLWALKRAFELELGAGGGPEKDAAYREKLTDGYRERYLEWVGRCRSEGDCVFVADVPDSDSDSDSDPGGGLAGYAFLLPETLAFVWDAAVLNELYVDEAHRGTGLADDLLDAAVDAARGQDLPLDRLVLDVDRENERARAFYRRHGFTHWGEMVARDL